MKYLLLLLIIIVTSCKTQTVTETQYRFVKDSTNLEVTRVIQAPIRNVTIIDRPCLEDSLIPIDQTLKVGTTQVKVSNEQGELKIEVEKPREESTSSKETSTLLEKQVDAKTVTITKTVTPKWAWWLLAITLLYVAYRLLRIQIPLLKMLPY